MKFFFDPEIQPQIENTYLNSTPAYIELQKHSVDPPGASYIYVFSWGHYSFFVAAHLGRDLDALNPFLQDPKMGKTWYGFYKEKWPSWGRLIDNGANSRYSDGVLLNIEDPDDGERKWVVGTVVGNLNVETVAELEQALYSERMMQAYALVLMASFTLAHEVITRPNPPIGVAKLYGRMLFQSYVDAIDLGAVWVPKITKLFGVYG
jgi:hypothetical protein